MALPIINKKDCNPCQKNSLADLTNIVTLVNNDDVSNQIIIEPSSLERLKRGEATTVILKSHPGMALSYFPSSKHQITEPSFVRFILCVRKNEQNYTKLRWEDRSWIHTSMYEETENKNVDFYVDVDLGKNEERRGIYLAHFDADWYRGSSFQINDNGSISPTDNDKLFLGTRGIVKEENMHDAILLRCEKEKIKSFIEEVNDVDTIISGRSALTKAAMMGDVDTVKLLINKYNASPNHDAVFFSPLHMAASFGHIEILKMLLDTDADRNAVNGHHHTPLHNTVFHRQWDCMTMLLDDDKTDVNLGPEYPLSIAIKKNQYEYVEYLLKNGALLDCIDKTGKCAIQQACSKANIDRLSMVTLLVKYQGDLSKDRIIDMRDDKKKVFFQAYANLSVSELARCGARCFLKSENSENFNPFLECTMLSEDVKQYYLKDQKLDSASADEFQKLFVKLQLISTCMLNQIYTDTSIENWEDWKCEASKEENRSEFLAEESSKKALELAHKLNSQCLFAQPVLSSYFAQTWYGDLMYDIFVESNKPNIIVFLGQLFLILILFIIQAPILPFLGLLPKNAFAQLQKVELPEIIVKHLCLRKRKAFIIAEPISLFLVQCITDLTLAIIFYRIGDNLVPLSRSPSFRLLLFALAGAFAKELKDLLSFKNLISYFYVDNFNVFDLPGLFLATLSLLIPLILQDSVDLVVLKTFLSFSTFLLWLRVLRILSLYSRTAHLTIIFFKMLRNMVEWLVLLLIMVIAFSTGIKKMQVANDDSWSYIDKLSPLDLFEDAMSPSHELFSFTKGTFLIYLFIFVCHILMVNMLIAMMSEAFSSVWDARASNFTFQRVTHCLDMQNKQNSPIQVMYLPFAIFDVMDWLTVKINNVMVGSCRNRKITESQEPLKITKYSSSDKNREDELTNIFEKYITSHQDEASEEDYWRVTLAKKSTQVMKRVEYLNEEVKQEMDSLKQGMKKEIESNKKEMKFLKQKVKQEMEANKKEIESLKQEMKQDMESLKQMLRVLINQKDA